MLKIIDILSKSMTVFILLLTVSCAKKDYQCLSVTGGLPGNPHIHNIQLFILFTLIVFAILGIVNLIIAIKKFIKRQKKTIIFFICALLFLFLPFLGVYHALSRFYVASLCPPGQAAFICTKQLCQSI